MGKAVSVGIVGMLLVAAFAPTASVAAVAEPDITVVEPDLAVALDELQPDEMTTVIVTLHGKADLSTPPGASRAARKRAVVKALRAKAKVSQRNLRDLLGVREGQGTVARAKPFWVVNAISVTATAEVIQELAARPDVASISSDEVTVVPTAGPPESNLTAVSAPAVWDLGYTGQGVVVASLDSGVDVNHPDLSTRWRGGTNSWFDPYGQRATPGDPTGHGTGVMGVMVGGDAGGTSIGMAPDAQWIAARVFDNSGGSTVTAIHAAFEWLLDPDGDPNTADAPDVVNNSWSLSSPSTCNLEFQPDLQALRAAGIVPVFAAGNFGPGPATSVSPANYPEALAVGAVDDSDQIYALSSLGPSACDPSAVYPHIVAPGVDIRTAERFGLYQQTSGTSLAAPHVAGALALLLSSDPDLTVTDQETALLESAVELGTPGPDSEFGHGRLDVMAAYLWLQIANEEDVTGPNTNAASLAPNPTVGTVDVALHATADDSATGGSNIDAAEYFIGTVGADGTGAAMTVGEAAPIASIDATISAAAAGALAEGLHVVSVHSQDAAGNWGPFQTVDLVIDRTGPTVGIVAPVNGSTVAAPVTVSGSAGDDVGVVEVRVEIYNRDLPRTRWWNGSGWQAGRTFVTAVLDSPGALTTDWSYVFDPPEVATRPYWSTVRAFDAAGNRSSRPVVNFKVMRGDAVAPTVVVVAPVNGSQVAAPASVFGVASDDVGVAEVRVEIYDRDTRDWWNGSGWQAGRTFVTATLDSADEVATDWEYVFDPPVPAVRPYWVTARAYDAAGNRSTRETINFRIR